jgi:Holliday junction resolvase-like predicted endonuclease
LHTGPTFEANAPTFIAWLRTDAEPAASWRAAGQGAPAAAGYAALERNFRTRYGELDLVARSPRAFFREVKTLVAGSCAGPPSASDAIGPAKRRPVSAHGHSVAREPALTERPLAASLRFVVIGVALTRAGEVAALEHLENAF